MSPTRFWTKEINDYPYYNDGHYPFISQLSIVINYPHSQVINRILKNNETKTTNKKQTIHKNALQHIY